MPQSKYKARLLLVEDEAVIAMDLEERLKKLHYDVCAVASTAEEAVRLTATHRPQLVIMDIRLAGATDGVQAANDIRKLVGIPHVYLTSYTDRATLSRARETRPLGYLVKPFSNHDLNNTIEVALYRDRAERKVTEHREWRDSLFRRIDDAVVAVDEKGGIRFLNAAAERLTGFREVEAMGRTFTSIWPPTGTAPAVAKDAREGSMILIGDMAERSQQRSQMLAAARVGCVARLAARLAHSFNDQLTVLANAAGTRNQKAGGDGLAAVDQIATAGNALNALVSELHMLAHPHAPNREPVDLNELVEDCTANVIRAVVPQSVEVDLDCGATDAMAFVDRAHIQEAVLDLVLTLRSRPNPSQVVSIRSESVNVRSSSGSEGQIAIWISDTAIDAARLEGSAGGDPEALADGSVAGLEQKIAEDLIRENGGSVERLPNGPDGAVFRILLPHIRSSQHTESRTAPVTPHKREGKRRALVVDDSSEIRRVVRAIMTAESYEILEAGSAEDAVAIAAGSEGGIDVLVTDVVLPCLSGVDLANRLLRENPSLVVVLMSGYTEDQLSSLRPRVEQSVFLAKPFTPKQLISTLQRKPPPPHV